MRMIRLLGMSITLSTGGHCHAQVVAAYYNSYVLCADGTVMASGHNMFGQLGNGEFGPSAIIPAQVIGLSDISAISCKGGATLALMTDGTVWSWGSNDFGQLGDNSGANACIPVQVDSIWNVMAIAGSSGHSLALANNGSVWAWGNNYYGQLGDGTTTERPTPVMVVGLPNASVRSVAVGGGHSLALMNDGTIWAWGRNFSGELGNGTTNDSPAPVQISTLSGIIAIDASATYSIALKDDGSLWTWGNNAWGELGNGTITDSPIPVQVTPTFGQGVVAISAGILHVLALRNDGTVWAWGNNWSDQLGNDTIPRSLIPIQVLGPPNGDVVAISAGEYHSLVQRGDGTVWGWGDNSDGQLGDGTLLNSWLPVQMTGLCQTVNSIPVSTQRGVLNIFPNPSTGTFTVDATRSADIEVRNAVGQEILHCVVNGARSEIDLSSQPYGVYVLTIRTAGQVISRKLIKE